MPILTDGERVWTFCLWLGGKGASNFGYQTVITGDYIKVITHLVNKKIRITNKLSKNLQIKWLICKIKKGKEVFIAVFQLSEYPQQTNLTLIFISSLDIYS